MSLDAAAEELYGVPLDQFVAERKRLAAALKAADDKPGARSVSELKKPTASAWVVNQLWRHDRDALDRLFAISARMREGDFAAGAEQRAALAALRQRAAEILRDGGHKPAEATLARIQQTPQALGAIGDWEPDEPGRLVEDRDPPGFEVLGGLAGRLPEIKREERPAPPPRPKREPGEDPEAAKARARLLVEQEVARLEEAFARAEAAVEAAARDVDRAKAALEAAETTAIDARRERNELERDLDRARKRL